MSGAPAPVFAQTTFPAGPDDTLFHRATTPSQCLMVYDRVLAGVQWRDSASINTGPRRKAEPKVISALGRCVARLNPRAVRAEAVTMYELAYALGQSDTAWSFLTRIRATLPPMAQQPLAHGSLLYEALNVAEKYPPYRLRDIDRLLRSLDSVPNDTSRYKLYCHHRNFTNAVALSDRAMIGREGDAVVHWFADWSQRVPESHLSMLQERANVVRVLSILAELEAIEIGMQPALVKLDERAKIVFGTKAEQIMRGGRVFGTRPPLISDSVLTLRPDGKIASIPMPTGKPTLMVFLADCTYDDRSSCIAAHAIIQRLHRQYGDSVSFIGVARTFGNVGLQLFTDSVKERAAMAEWYLKTVGLPLGLVVEQSQYTQKPDPDRRFTPLPTRAVEVYGKQDGWLGLNLAVLDRSGVSSAVHWLDEGSEAIVRMLLDAAVANRQAGKPITATSSAP